MYDSAKRRLAFAVATGGVLLAGTAYSQALADVGAARGPARALDVRVDTGSTSRPVHAAIRDAAIRDAAVTAGGADRGPAKVSIEVCGNTVTAGPIGFFQSASSCTNTAEGSAPTVPGAPAPGTGGASATAVSVNAGGAAGFGILGGSGGGTGSRNAVTTRMNAPVPCKCSPGAPSRPWSPPPHPAPSRHPGKCKCSHTSPGHPSPPPAPAGSPPTKCACSKPPAPPSPPPPAPGWPPPAPGSPPPPHSWPPSRPESSPVWPDHPSGHHPGGPPPHNGNGGGGLAHTGTDIGIALGVAAAAMLGGLGLRAAARRRGGRG